MKNVILMLPTCPILLMAKVVNLLHHEARELSLLMADNDRVTALRD